MSQALPWTPTAKEACVYEAMYQRALKDPQGNVLASHVKSLFESARPGVQRQDLKRIWDIANRARVHGRLTKPDFFCALRLVALVQMGSAVSDQSLRVRHVRMPGFTGVDDDAIWKAFQAEKKRREEAARQGKKPGGALDWFMHLSFADQTIYDGLYAHADPKRANTVSASRVREMFVAADPPVPSKTLAEIWRCSKTTELPKLLTKTEYYRALRLLALAQKGYPPSNNAFDDATKLKIPAPRFRGVDNGRFLETREYRAEAKRRKLKNQISHHKAGTKCKYLKEGIYHGEIVTVVKPHFDDPDEVYYTIKRKDGSERQTVKKYLEALPGEKKRIDPFFDC